MDLCMTSALLICWQINVLLWAATTRHETSALPDISFIKCACTGGGEVRAAQAHTFTHYIARGNFRFAGGGEARAAQAHTFMLYIARGNFRFAGGGAARAAQAHTFMLYIARGTIRFAGGGEARAAQAHTFMLYIARGNFRFAGGGAARAAQARGPAHDTIACDLADEPSRACRRRRSASCAGTYIHTLDYPCQKNFTLQAAEAHGPARDGHAHHMLL